MPVYSCQNCGDPFSARKADRARGWARYCSKSCKAREQTRRTGYSGPYVRWLDNGWEEQALEDLEGGWGGHKIWR